MPENITVTYTLDSELWRAFYKAHFDADRGLKLRYVWGVLCVVIGAAGFGGVYSRPAVATLLLLTGLFAVLSKSLLVERSLRRARRHPYIGRQLTVTISPAELSVASGSSAYAQSWSDFIGYRQVAAGLMLYHRPHTFFFIPESALTADTSRRIETLLAAAGVAKL